MHLDDGRFQFVMGLSSSLAFGQKFKLLAMKLLAKTAYN